MSLEKIKSSKTTTRRDGRGARPDAPVGAGGADRGAAHGAWAGAGGAQGVGISPIGESLVIKRERPRIGNCAAYDGDRQVLPCREG